MPAPPQATSPGQVPIAGAPRVRTAPSTVLALKPPCLRHSGRGLCDTPPASVLISACPHAHGCCVMEVPRAWQDAPVLSFGLSSRPLRIHASGGQKGLLSEHCPSSVNGHDNSAAGDTSQGRGSASDSETPASPRCYQIRCPVRPQSRSPGPPVSLSCLLKRHPLTLPAGSWPAGHHRVVLMLWAFCGRGCHRRLTSTHRHISL